MFKHETLKNLALTGALVGVLGAGACGGEVSTSPPAAVASADQAPDCATSVVMPAQTNPAFASQPTHSFRFDSHKSTSPDQAAWTYELNPDVPTWNEEQAAYTDKNADVEGCDLVLQARKEPYTYPNGTSYEYTSARLVSKFSFSYGKVVVRAQLPAGRGTWPALWLISADEPYTQGAEDADYDADDRLSMRNGEPDFMEAYGDKPGVVEGSVHTYAKSYEEQVAVPDCSTAFHNYSAELGPDKITYAVDGQPYMTVTKPAGANIDKWPYTSKNQFRVVADIAMGGIGGGAIDDTQASHWNMRIKALDFYPKV